MKNLLFCCALLLGCNTVSDEAMKEVSDAAIIGDRIYRGWDDGVQNKDGTFHHLTEAEKKEFIYKFTRTCFNIKADVQEAEIPELYKVKQ